MKTSSSKLALIVAALVLLATGYAFRESTVEAGSKEEVINEKSKFSSPRESDSRTHFRGELDRRSAGSDPERLLRLVALIEGCSLDLLPDLAIQYAKDEVIIKLITLHWLNLDPDHCLQKVVEKLADPSFPAENVLYFLSEEWQKKNLSGFNAALESIPPSHRGSWHFTDIYCDISERDYQTGFRLMREAGMTDTSPNSPLIDELAKEDPQKLANDLRRENTGHVLTAALGQVARVWAKSEPEAALDYALAIPGKRGQEMSTYALASWAKSSPQAAASWLTEQNNTRVQDDLRPVLIRAWKAEDPEAARHYCLTRLSGFRQRKALRVLEEKHSSYHYLDD